MKIFIFYSRRDATHYVEHIYEYLKDFGHDIFTDTKNIRGGEVWSEVIGNNISICDYFVIILTPASLNSPEVEKEVLFAIDKEKNIQKKTLVNLHNFVNTYKENQKENVFISRKYG